MATRLNLGGSEVELTGSLEWESSDRRLELFLNRVYGADWRPADPLAYVADEVRARAEAVAEALDGEILKLGPIDSGPAGRVY